MAIALWWWVILITAVVLVITMYNMPRVTAISILVVLLTLVYWFLGPYFRLSAAGLAVEIFRGKGAAKDEPEEEGPVTIQMGSWEVYQKRKEEASGAQEE
jgi:type VI protein secretion system component VasK